MDDGGYFFTFRYTPYRTDIVDAIEQLSKMIGDLKLARRIQLDEANLEHLVKDEIAQEIKEATTVKKVKYDEVPNQKVPENLEYLNMRGAKTLKIGQTIELWVEAYNENAQRIALGEDYVPGWKVDEEELVELSSRAGSRIKLTARHAGVCYVKAYLGKVDIEEAIEIKGGR